GFADQHRVVFCPPAKNLDDPVYLIPAADHRVEFAFSGFLSQISAKLVERRSRTPGLLLSLRLSHGCGGSNDFGYLSNYCFSVNAHALEHLGGNALTFFDQAKEDMLRADISVTPDSRLLERQIEHTLSPRRESNAS